MALTGCATPPMPAQQPTLQNIQALRTIGAPPLALGTFELAPGLPPSVDRSVIIRASSVKAPGGSLSQYLRQTLESELRGAGKLDPASPVTISAQLTRSAVTSATPKGSGTLAARFKLTTGGQTIYERELSVTDEWDSSFLGAVAIPLSMDRYTALYPKLVTALLTDPAFQAAIGAIP